MYFLFRKFWEKKFLRKKNSKNRFSKMSKMSNYGYTTETFAIVYTLFDAVQKTRPESRKKMLESVYDYAKYYTLYAFSNFFL